MYSDRDLMNMLGAAGAAFFGSFEALRQVQRLSIPAILSGKDSLLCAATASGKTEAVFAPLAARLRQKCKRGGRGVRLLAVAPTRALVNDLHARLEYPLMNLQWHCGRQTSDHADKFRRPEVLITTPESFDSMLVRDAVRERGSLMGHLFANVHAVFLDEAHLLAASARGDQLQWLLARLRILRKYAFNRQWSTDSDVQVCAASATVADPTGLAQKLIGKHVEIIEAPGIREMELFTNNKETPWVPIEALGSVRDIYRLLPRLESSIMSYGGMSKLLWQSMQLGGPEKIRKLLVFVPSRTLCDGLSSYLGADLTKKRDLWVGGHHGSLERVKREAAEREFAARRDAVLVSTTTLELGIDIGDVDAVALVGPPPDTSSLLQRIGRSGRRSGCARIIPICRDEIESSAFASMVYSSCREALEKTPFVRRWSVFIQQAASYISQTGGKGRRRSDLLSLASEVWPEPGQPSLASLIIDRLLQEKMLIASGDRVYLGDTFSDRFGRAGSDLHCNFEVDRGDIPVLNGTTGEVIARVGSTAETEGPVALAGKQWKALNLGDEILVRPAGKSRSPETFRYASRSAPRGRNFAEHVRRGVGLNERDAPIVETAAGLLWFHFGGSAYENVLRKIYPNLRGITGLAGLATSGTAVPENSEWPRINRDEVVAIVREYADTLAKSFSPGRFHRMLPQEVRSSVVIDLFDVDTFLDWLRTRRIHRMTSHEISLSPLGRILPFLNTSAPVPSSVPVEQDDSM